MPPALEVVAVRATDQEPLLQASNSVYFSDLSVISLIVSESYFWAAVRLAKEACVAHFPTLK